MRAPHTHEIWNLHTKQTLVAIKFKRPTHATWPAFVHAELKEIILALKQKKAQGTIKCQLGDIDGLSASDLQ